MSKYGIAIIGSGWGARVQVPTFKKAGFDINSIWVRSQQKAKDIAEQNGIPHVSTNYDEILARKDVQLATIVTPTFLHVEMCKKALNAGKHVLLEKPMAMDVKEAEDLLHFVTPFIKEKKQLVVLDHELRYLKTMKKMKDLISQGYCGKIFHVTGNITLGSRLIIRE